MNYEKYEKECELIRKENADYLDIFFDYLVDHNIGDKTIDKHNSNVDFFLNTFLLCYEPLHMAEGINHIDEYLGYFFIRKCMWSTPASIKTTAASIKKFYKCMLENGKIGQEDYDLLCEIIKDGMEDWQNDCAKFNDPECESPFSFF